MQAPAHRQEVTASRLVSPDLGGEVVDRAAAPAPVAVPAAARLVVDVQTCGVVVVERAAHLAPTADLDAEKGNLQRALGRYNGSLGRPDYPNLVIGAWRSTWQYQGRLTYSPERILGPG